MKASRMLAVFVLVLSFPILLRPVRAETPETHSSTPGAHANDPFAGWDAYVERVL